MGQSQSLALGFFAVVVGRVFYIAYKDPKRSKWARRVATKAMYRTTLALISEPLLKLQVYTWMLESAYKYVSQEFAEATVFPTYRLPLGQVGAFMRSRLTLAGLAVPFA